MSNFVFFFFFLILSFVHALYSSGAGRYGRNSWDSQRIGGVPMIGSSRLLQPKCIRIPNEMTLCQNLEYKEMRLPNLLNHEDMREVVEQSHSWVPLANTYCHSHVKHFLCSLFAPVCLKQFEVVKPCREFCLNVRRDCEPVMRRYNYSWPEMLDCEKFPRVAEEDNICIELSNNMGTTVETIANNPKSTKAPSKSRVSKEKSEKRRKNSCKFCPNKFSTESIVHAFCGSQLTMRVKIRDIVDMNTMASRNIQKGRFMSYKGNNTVVYRRLILTKKRKIMNRNNAINKKQARKWPVVVEWPQKNGKDKCQCASTLDMSKANAYLIMLNKDLRTNQLRVSYVIPWQKRKKRAFKKALKFIRHSTVTACAKGGVIEAINKIKKESLRKKRKLANTNRKGQRKQNRRKKGDKKNRKSNRRSPFNRNNY